MLCRWLNIRWNSRNIILFSFTRVNPIIIFIIHIILYYYYYYQNITTIWVKSVVIKYFFFIEYFNFLQLVKATFRRTLKFSEYQSGVQTTSFLFSTNRNAFSTVLHKIKLKYYIHTYRHYDQNIILIAISYNPSDCFGEWFLII